jgi:hypothetical protein
MPVTKNKNWERAYGISGSVLAGPWVFVAVWHLIDWIGRAQTAMAITPHLGVLVNPLATLLELIGAVGLLFYATRLEHAREADDAPRIIMPFALPEKPRRHWFWLKVATAISVLACAGAVVVAISMRHIVTARPQPPTVALPVGRGGGTNAKSAATPIGRAGPKVETPGRKAADTGPNPDKSNAVGSSTTKSPANPIGPPANPGSEKSQPSDRPITVAN